MKCKNCAAPRTLVRCDYCGDGAVAVADEAYARYRTNLYGSDLMMDIEEAIYEQKSKWEDQRRRPNGTISFMNALQSFWKFGL